jgi:trk system potassium uptake protein TrkA
MEQPMEQPMDERSGGATPGGQQGIGLARTRRRQQVAVLGLGRFGGAVARELTRLGHEVLGIDSAERVVKDVMEDITHAAQADISDEDALRALGVGDFDTAIVAVSSNLEASILGTVLCARLGVKRIIARAGNALHGSILQQVGAIRVVYPEQETGLRIAHSFAAAAVQDYLDVAPGYGIARVAVTEQFVGKFLSDVELAATGKGVRLTPLALIRRGTVLLHPDASEALRAGDALIVAGRDEDLERLPGQPRAPSPPAT